MQNVHGFLGDDVPLDVQVRDVYEGIEERDLDRDRARPARAVARREARARGVRPGGILLAYLPTILQVGRLREELAERAVRDDRVARGAAAHVARGGPVDPPRPPHGRAHRFPHRTPACWHDDT